MNIFEALRESHEIQRDLSEKLLQTSGDSPERHELFKQLKNELFAHETAEDRYFLYSADDDRFWTEYYPSCFGRTS